MRREASASYFPYIDGLRALAVLSVLIYHLHGAWLPGGFVGVDVFFVISGFIVSASVMGFQGKSLKHFLLHFYARRIKRIFPALVVCLLVTAYVSALFIPESWLSSVNQRTGLSAFVGLSNFVLASSGRDYFAPTTDFNPYTHTWSLGVEEQFYLLFPFLFVAWLAGGRPRRVSLLLCVVGALASVAYAIWQAKQDPTLAFFLSPARFWELAAGMLLFQFISRRHAAPVRSKWLLPLGVLSLGALLASFWVSNPNGFPLPSAWLAVLSTVGVILCLHQSPELPLLHRLLGNRLLVSVGRISYSLYLWHWPVFVLFRWTCGLDTVLTQSLAAVLAVTLAVLSYRFVENPVRQSVKLRALPQYAVILYGAALIWGAYSIAHKIEKKTENISLSVLASNPAAWYPNGVSTNEHFPGCEVKGKSHSIGSGDYLDFSPQGCKRTTAPSGFRIFVIGDSHSLAYSALFKQYALANPVAIRAYRNGGCPFISLQPARDIDNPRCRAFSEEALNDIRQQIKPGDVLFLPSLRLPRLADQWVYFGEEAVAAQLFSPQAQADRQRAQADAIAVLQVFSDKGVHIVFEAPKPLFKAPPLRCGDWFNRHNPVCAPGFEMARAQIEHYRAPVLDSFAAIAQALPGTEVWDPLPVLCPGAVCNAFDQQLPLFLDGDHLSGHGNKQLLPAFTAFMNARLGQPVVVDYHASSAAP
jgi:peptidoglycan/LPS O-acetylase OafA/YrhL